MQRVLLLLTALAIASLGTAQQASILRSTNLRQAPNNNSTIISTLDIGKTVTLTSSRRRAGYFHVRTSEGDVGWVWFRNLSTNAPQLIREGRPVPAVPLPGMFSQTCLDPAYPSADATPIDSSCPVEGKGGTEVAQNKVKNQFCASDPARPVTIQDLVALEGQVETDRSIPFGNPRNHPMTSQPGPATERSALKALGEGTRVVLTGFVKIARQEGAESVNCGTAVPNQAAYHDIHISIVDQAGGAECGGVVAEMIPHHRPTAWTFQLVNKVAASNLLVRVTGDMMFDSSHSPCQNGSSIPGDPSRASLWEVHPIYKFEVCTEADCSSGQGWVPLELWQP